MKKIWKQYVKERYQHSLGILALWGFLNFYLFFLCDADFYVWDLIYLNLLLGSVAVCVQVCDFFRYRRLQKCLAGEDCKEQELEKLMGTQMYLAWKQEEEQQKKELLQQKKYLDDLSDYIARWSHEAKLPLAAWKLMNGRNENEELRKEMESSIARLESLMHTVLMGSKLERPEHDVKFERILLEEVIKESIQNRNLFYLLLPLCSYLPHVLFFRKSTGKCDAGRTVSCEPVECRNYFPGIYLYLFFLSTRSVEKIVLLINAIDGHLKQGFFSV